MDDRAQVRLEPEDPAGGDCRWRWTYDEETSPWFATRDEAFAAAEAAHPEVGIG